MADVKPFRALRYDERRAGPLARAGRAAVRRDLGGSPRALPDEEPVQRRPPDAAGRRGGRRRGARRLAGERRPRAGRRARALVARAGLHRPRRRRPARDGLVAALAARAVRGGRRPAARAHPRRAEGGAPAAAARDADARRADLPALRGRARRAAGASRRSTSSSTACAAACGASRARRRPSSRTRRLLIADGHHRYETALAFHAEDGRRGERVDAGRDRPDPPGRPDDLPDAPHRRAHEAAAAARDVVERRRPRRRRGVHARRVGLSARRAGRAGRASWSRGTRPSVGYTPYADEARAAVDAGDAEAAFLLRPPTVEQVAAVAKAGRTMPQKSTFFYPKLTSGLFFLPA